MCTSGNFDPHGRFRSAGQARLDKVGCDQKSVRVCPTRRSNGCETPSRLIMFRSSANDFSAEVARVVVLLRTDEVLGLGWMSAQNNCAQNSAGNASGAANHRLSDIVSAQFAHSIRCSCAARHAFANRTLHRCQRPLGRSLATFTQRQVLTCLGYEAVIPRPRRHLRQVPHSEHLSFAEGSARDKWAMRRLALGNQKASEQSNCTPQRATSSAPHLLPKISTCHGVHTPEERKTRKSCPTCKPACNRAALWSGTDASC